MMAGECNAPSHRRAPTRCALAFNAAWLAARLRAALAFFFPALALWPWPCWNFAIRDLQNLPYDLRQTLLTIPNVCTADLLPSFRRGLWVRSLRRATAGLRRVSSARILYEGPRLACVPHIFEKSQGKLKSFCMCDCMNKTRANAAARHDTVFCFQRTGRTPTQLLTHIVMIMMRSMSLAGRGQHRRQRTRKRKIA